jgi:hypothetical protein
MPENLAIETFYLKKIRVSVGILKKLGILRNRGSVKNEQKVLNREAKTAKYFSTYSGRGEFLFRHKSSTPFRRGWDQRVPIRWSPEKSKGELMMSTIEPDVENKHQVRIHIDQQRYESPNPTTSQALYLLGKVSAGNDLYREVDGNREDEPVWNGGEEIHLREDEHFHSGPAKQITIIVNGRKREVTSRVLTFMQVVALAFDPLPSGPDWVFTVSYRKSASKPHEGTLTQGEDVKVRNGTVFNVTATNKS